MAANAGAVEMADVDLEQQVAVRDADAAEADLSSNGAPGPIALEKGGTSSSGGEENGMSQRGLFAAFKGSSSQTRQRSKAPKSLPVTLRWKSVCKSVHAMAGAPGSMAENDASASGGAADGGMKQVLFDASGLARPGEVVAIMGPSGSGKTTLLNILGQRAMSSVTGEITANGMPLRKAMKRFIAYVLQDDIFFSHLTVRDQLTYTALLRIPAERGDEAILAEVERVCDTLNMQSCMETKIMLISGGERKRTNIATELLTDPAVMLLDEPTSGLDSSTAMALMKTLRKLARLDKTIMLSIHQPSTQVFYSFDRLLLLADGHTVYWGAPQQCMTYLASLGYVPAANYNPADYVMDLINAKNAFELTTAMDGDIGASEEAARALANDLSASSTGVSGDDPNSKSDDDDDEDTVQQELARVAKPLPQGARIPSGSIAEMPPKERLISEWNDAKTLQEVDADETAAADDQGFAALTKDLETTLDQRPNSYWRQTAILTRRALRNSRSTVFKPLNIVQSVGVALISGLVWFQMRNKEAYVRDKQGFIFFFSVYWFMSSLFLGMMAFPPERSVLMKERAAGSYQLSAYFVSKTIAEFPVRMLLPALYLVIAYWMAGMNPRIDIFLAVVGTELVVTLAGESVGLFIGTVYMDMEKGLVVATLYSLGMMLTGGFFVDNLPVFVDWVRYLSPFRYAQNACMRLEFSDNINTRCDNTEYLEACSDTGDYYMRNGERYVDGPVVADELDAEWSPGVNVAIMIGILVIFRVLAYLALRFLNHNQGRE